MQLTEAVATVVKFDLELATAGALEDDDALAALEGKLRETLSCFAGCDLKVAVDGATVEVEAIVREDIAGGAAAAAALRAGANKVEFTRSAAACSARRLGSPCGGAGGRPRAQRCDDRRGGADAGATAAGVPGREPGLP